MSGLVVSPWKNQGKNTPKGIHSDGRSFFFPIQGLGITSEEKGCSILQVDESDSASSALSFFFFAFLFLSFQWARRCCF